MPPRLSKPPVSKPLAISSAEARSLWLAAQGLAGAPAFGSGQAGALAALRRLGYVQIDTIHVVARAHHHVLWSRVPNYQPSQLCTIQSEDKEVFEGWTHALSYVPREDFKYFVRSMREHERAPSQWYGTVLPADRRKLLRRIREEGAVSIRDIEETKQEKTHLWASRKPSKRVLEFLFHSGRLAIASRDGMLKRYELLERHFGWDKRPASASAREEAGYLVDRALRAQGLVTLESTLFLETELREQVRAELERRVRQGALAKIRFEDLPQDFYVNPDALAQTPGIDRDPGSAPAHLLSPFDPLIIQRKRVKALFGFDYTLECYLPASKRKYGYFVLPVLIGDRFVARLDLKADREAKRLLIKAWHWEPVPRRGAGSLDKRALRARIEETLDRYERFCCEAR